MIVVMPDWMDTLAEPTFNQYIKTGIIMGSGDFACQWLTRKQAEREAAERGEKGEKGEKGGYDLRRTAKFAFMGSLIIGPTLHHWYSFLARTFPGSTTAAAGTNCCISGVAGPSERQVTKAPVDPNNEPLPTLPHPKHTVKRLIVDQSVFAPTFIPIFFTGLQFLDLNFDVADIKAKLEADYLDTLVANWQLVSPWWCPGAVIDF